MSVWFSWTIYLILCYLCRICFWAWVYILKLMLSSVNPRWSFNFPFTYPLLRIWNGFVRWIEGTKMISNCPFPFIVYLSIIWWLPWFLSFLVHLMKNFFEYTGVDFFRGHKLDKVSGYQLFRALYFLLFARWLLYEWYSSIYYSLGSIWWPWLYSNLIGFRWHGSYIFVKCLYVGCLKSSLLNLINKYEWSKFLLGIFLLSLATMQYCSVIGGFFWIYLAITFTSFVLHLDTLIISWALDAVVNLLFPPSH